MDPNLQQELHALAQNLHDGHFTILSRGIGLGVERKNPLTPIPEIKEDPVFTEVAKEIAPGPALETPPTPIPQPIKILPKLPLSSVNRAQVKKPDNSPKKKQMAAKVQKTRNWRLLQPSRIIKGIFSIAVDLVVVLLSVASMALLILSLGQPRLDISTQLIQITKDAAFFITALKGLALITCLALFAYKTLFHFLLGRTLGELLLSRDK